MVVFIKPGEFVILGPGSHVTSEDRTNNPGWRPAFADPALSWNVYCDEPNALLAGNVTQAEAHEFVKRLAIHMANGGSDFDAVQRLKAIRQGVAKAEQDDN